MQFLERANNFSVKMGQSMCILNHSASPTAKDKEFLEISKNASVLLANRAEARFQLGDVSGAIIDAAASTFIDQSYKKAAFRLIKAYHSWHESSKSSWCTTNYLLSSMGECHSFWIQTTLASALVRIWPSFRRTSLFRSSLQCDSTSPIPDLWWEKSGFIQTLYHMKSAQPVSVSHAGTWIDMKSKANKHFNSRQFELARDGYSRALQDLDITNLVDTLIECSKSSLQITGDCSRALMYATVAIVLQPSSTASWLARTRVMEKLRRFDEALECCKAARKTVTGTKQILRDIVLNDIEAMEMTIRPKLGKAQAQQMVASKNNKSPSSRKMLKDIEASEKAITSKLAKASEDKSMTTIQPQEMPLDEVITSTIKVAISMSQPTNRMYIPQRIEQMWLGISAQDHIRMFGTKLKPMPNLRDEFIKYSDGWPAGLDTWQGREYLDKIYQYVRVLPFAPQILFRNSMRGLPDQRQLEWRLGVGRYFEPWFRWVKSYPPLGSIRPEYPEAWNGYTYSVRHDFSNSVHPIVTLQKATTHVAIGFVDLGILLVADLEDDPTGNSAPVSFVGYELSAVAVAKTIVIWQMLCDKSTSPSAVLQVWFSLGWTQPALEAFRKAVSAARGSAQYAVAEDQVKNILDHWAASKGVKISKARRNLSAKKLSMTGNDNSFIGFLERRKDRLALTQYDLTGDFGLQGESATAGSITFFDCPKGTPAPLLEENMFSSLDFGEVVRESQACATDVVSAAENLYLGRVRRLADWATTGVVTVTLHCQKVETAVADAIHKLSPRTMSWSNIMDYMSYPEFHKLVRACSLGQSTTHYGYSMKWDNRVFGTSLLDFEYAKNKMECARIIQSSNIEMVKMYKSLGWDKYLRLPVPEDPRTTVQRRISRRYHETWVKYFFSESDCRQFSHSSAPPVPLAESGFTNILLTWKY